MPCNIDKVNSPTIPVVWGVFSLCSFVVWVRPYGRSAWPLLGHANTHWPWPAGSANHSKLRFPLPPVALSGKTAKNPHLRVKVSTCLYAWRGQAQQPSNTLIVWFSSTRIHQIELFTPIISRWMIIQNRIEHLGCWHGCAGLSERSKWGNMPHGRRYSDKPYRTRRIRGNYLPRWMASAPFGCPNLNFVGDSSAHPCLDATRRHTPPT